MPRMFGARQTPAAPATVVGIAGFSCSGKTTLSKRIAATLSELSPQVLGLDAFYRDLSGVPLEERARVNFDAPDALEWPLAIACVHGWLRGETVQAPVYDYGTHSRVPGRATPLRPGGLLIVEGLHALHAPELRRIYALSVFVRASHESCLARRIERDVACRARTREAVRRQYAETVRPMADRFIRPTERYADLVVDGAASQADNANRLAAALRKAIAERA